MDRPTSDETVHYQRQHGIKTSTRLLRDGVTDVPHPSKGGSKGYPYHERVRWLKMWKTDPNSVPTSMISSLKRWEKRIHPYRQTGGKRRQTMSGHHLYLLVLFKKIYPQASASQSAVFVAVHSADNRVFTDREISKALRGLNFTRKKGSTTAYEAFSPVNLKRHFQFWNYSFPAGVVGVRRRDLIAIDECSFCVGDATQTYGHAVKGLRVRKVGNYGRGKAKFTLILAVEAGDPDLDNSQLGSIAKPRIWYHLSPDKGTTTVGYVDFLKHNLMDKFEVNERQRTIMHDNLSSHKADEVFDTIHSRGHRVICRVPYRPNEAPIEFVFDMVSCEVRRRWAEIQDENQLHENICDILDNRLGLDGFDELFRNCGYVYEEESTSNEMTPASGEEAKIGEDDMDKLLI